MTVIDAAFTLLVVLFLLAISPLVLIAGLLYGIGLGLWRAFHGQH